MQVLSWDPGLLFDPGIENSGWSHAGIGMQRNVENKSECREMQKRLHHNALCIFYNTVMWILCNILLHVYIVVVHFSEMQLGCDALYHRIAIICVPLSIQNRISDIGIFMIVMRLTILWAQLLFFFGFQNPISSYFLPSCNLSCMSSPFTVCYFSSFDNIMSLCQVNPDLRCYCHGHRQLRSSRQSHLSASPQIPFLRTSSRLPRRVRFYSPPANLPLRMLSQTSVLLRLLFLTLLGLCPILMGRS